MINPQAALCTAAHSLLVFLDIQEKMFDAIEVDAATQTVNNASSLIFAAHALKVPTLFTQQHTDKLGRLHPTLLEARYPESRMLEKTCFSACDSQEFLKYLKMSGRCDIILSGMETHVCVLQTAFSLFEDGYKVFVIEDAVCSRHSHNHSNALHRMRAAGIQITNCESVLFEWIRDSSHPHFKQIVKKLVT